MPSVNIQFHMLFDELVEFAKEACALLPLEIELERFFPTTVRAIESSSDLAAEVEEFGHVDRIWFIYRGQKSHKPEKFMLNVGQQRGKRLSQAQLGAGTNKVKALEVLKKLAGLLKRRTKAGIWLENAIGSIGYVKDQRISERTKEATRAGLIELVSMAFTCSYLVDPPDVVEA
jgi:hypothetical protein